MLKIALKTAILLTMTCAQVWAADLPDAGPNDARIRLVVYKPNEVTLVRVQRGVVTRIMLEADEKIEVPVVGLSSKCESELDEWCISAIIGSNQIFVRPRDSATSNNMELHTNKRDYSFVFELVQGSVSHGKSKQTETFVVPFFRVVFDYPKPKPPPMVAPDLARAAAVDDLLRRVDASVLRQVPQKVDPDFGMLPAQRLKAEGIQVRNANYTKQVLPKGEDADPTMVFDDGRFTYFEFPGAREIPAIFAIGSDEEATRVNWHMSGAFVVVQRTARKFTIRLGDAVVGIFNESYDATGIDTPTSTVSPAVMRETKGESR
jgi:type IV secretion system protein VirB9